MGWTGVLFLLIGLAIFIVPSVSERKLTTVHKIFGTVFLVLAGLTFLSAQSMHNAPQLQQMTKQCSGTNLVIPMASICP